MSRLPGRTGAGKRDAHRKKPRWSARLQGLSRLSVGRATLRVENLEESPKIREKEFPEIIGGIYRQEHAVRFQLPPV